MLTTKPNKQANLRFRESACNCACFFRERKRERRKESVPSMTSPWTGPSPGGATLGLTPTWTGPPRHPKYAFPEAGSASSRSWLLRKGKEMVLRSRLDKHPHMQKAQGKGRQTVGSVFFGPRFLYPYSCNLVYWKTLPPCCLYKPTFAIAYRRIYGCFFWGDPQKLLAVLLVSF